MLIKAFVRDNGAGRRLRRRCLPALLRRQRPRTTPSARSTSAGALTRSLCRVFLDAADTGRSRRRWSRSCGGTGPAPLLSGVAPTLLLQDATRSSASTNPTRRRGAHGAGRRSHCAGSTGATTAARHRVTRTPSSCGSSGISPTRGDPGGGEPPLPAFSACRSRSPAVNATSLSLDRAAGDARPDRRRHRHPGRPRPAPRRARRAWSAR